MSVVRTVDDEPLPSVRPTELTTRQRLALVVGGALSPQDVLSAEDATLDFAYFVKHKIGSEALASVGIGPLQLKQRGATKPAQLCELGHETLDLCEDAFCAEAVAAFGADALVEEFLATPNDALLLAGTSAADQLGLDVGTLLCMCEGDFGIAYQVLLQCKPRGQCLTGVAPLTLLESGLRKTQLTSLGYVRASVAEQTHASEDELVALGF